MLSSWSHFTFARLSAAVLPVMPQLEGAHCSTGCPVCWLTVQRTSPSWSSLPFPKASGRELETVIPSLLCNFIHNVSVKRVSTAFKVPSWCPVTYSFPSSQRMLMNNSAALMGNLPTWIFWTQQDRWGLITSPGYTCVIMLPGALEYWPCLTL